MKAQHLVLEGRPLRINSIDRAHWWQVNAERKKWRKKAKEQAEKEGLQPLKRPVVVRVRQEMTGRLTDAGANFHAAKGAIDGLVDAKVLMDDGPHHVWALWFSAPCQGERDVLILDLMRINET